MSDTIIKLLLIEDNPDDADLLQETLTETIRPHFVVTHAETLGEGFHHLVEEHFDAVLLDLGLPDSFGLDTLLQTLHEAPVDLPIVVLTGNEDVELSVKAVQAGAQDFLVKNWTNRELLVRTVLYAIERKRAEEKLQALTEELRRSNQELEQFAYVASHDLQEPLRMITSYLQLLERRYNSKLGEDADRYIQYAVDGAGRMKTLINDLLAYSRVGTRGRAFGPIDCELIFNRIHSNLQLAIAESGAAVTHDRLPTVIGDEVQLVQLFQNLISNALKFHSDAPPKIHVSAKLQNETWRFSVRDNGIGIEPEFSERIFVIFQRLHTRKEYSGTGLGLAICKKIVERHGGQIWVEPNADQGSTFYFTLPVEEKQKKFQADPLDQPGINVPALRSRPQ